MCEEESSESPCLFLVFCFLVFKRINRFSAKQNCSYTEAMSEGSTSHSYVRKFGFVFGFLVFFKSKSHSQDVCVRFGSMLANCSGKLCTWIQSSSNFWNNSCWLQWMSKITEQFIWNWETLPWPRRLGFPSSYWLTPSGRVLWDQNQGYWNATVSHTQWSSGCFCTFYVCSWLSKTCSLWSPFDPSMRNFVHLPLAILFKRQCRNIKKSDEIWSVLTSTY